MDLYGFFGGTPAAERQPAYQNLFISNADRYESFLKSMVNTALEIERQMLFQSVIKAINFHAVVGLHHEAGHYRTYRVGVGIGENQYNPPEHYSVQPMMDDFVNVVNWRWQESDSFELAAFALWRINHIHPFVNGNGRTARAVCYFIICVKSGMWLPGRDHNPEMMKQEPYNTRYIEALKRADKGDEERDTKYLDGLVAILKELMSKQMA